MILSDFNTGTFAADGTCTVQIAPASTEMWDISSYTVKTSDPVSGTVFPIAEATCGDYSEATYSGNMDTSNTPMHLEKGQPLTVKWTGGTVGRTATVSVIGTRTRY
jgi:hypothetical protein